MQRKMKIIWNSLSIIRHNNNHIPPDQAKAAGAKETPEAQRTQPLIHDTETTHNQSFGNSN